MDLEKLKASEDKILRAFEDAPRSTLSVGFKYLATVLNVRISQVDVEYEIVSAFKKEQSP